ncbi:MAG: sensor histidine kinase [Anaerotignaceae bacterium]
MIKKLQQKFVLITMTSLLLVFVIIIGSINAINIYQMNRKADSVIAFLAENDGAFPEFEKKGNSNSLLNFEFQLTAETRFETRYFVVEFTKDGIAEETNVNHIAAISGTEAQAYATQILLTGKTNGYSGIYRYRVIDTPTGVMVVFVDCHLQMQTQTTFLLISCGIAFLSFVVMFILVSVFSKKAIKPVIETFEKQKQFVTDASHEIKTPLAIISANTDVLELCNGKSEWTDSIRNQTTRLSSLVANLLTLSKMEEAQPQLTFCDFCLSDAVAQASTPFKTLAETQNKQVEFDIAPNISFIGDESSIRMLISILMDNAIKYASNNGQIKISLHQQSKSVRLEVFNTCESIDEKELTKVFDRFYRMDSSRARETGGYGIGLSIAKAIVHTHKAKITATCEQGSGVKFIVIL